MISFCRTLSLPWLNLDFCLDWELKSRKLSLGSKVSVELVVVPDSNAF